jgi:hypothetical protein
MGAGPSQSVVSQQEHTTVTRTSQQKHTTRNIVYNVNDKVSFTKNGSKVSGIVKGVTCNFYIDERGTTYGGLCDLQKSTISVLDNQGIIHIIGLMESTLQIENMTVDEAIEKYKLGRRVSFIHKYKPTIGIINGYGIKVGAVRISKDDTVSIYLPKGLDRESSYDNISFTDPNLKLAPISISEADKYSVGKKVSFYWGDEIKTGTIKDVKIIKENEVNIDETLSSLTVKIDDTDKEEEIRFTIGELKLVEESGSGNKKYTLEEDSKYRVKYTKYKAKYLLQKNNLYN